MAWTTKYCSSGKEILLASSKKCAPGATRASPVRTTARKRIAVSPIADHQLLVALFFERGIPLSFPSRRLSRRLRFFLLSLFLVSRLGLATLITFEIFGLFLSRNWLLFHHSLHE